jgi:hypothetical protein
VVGDVDVSLSDGLEEGGLRSAANRSVVCVQAALKRARTSKYLSGTVLSKETVSTSTRANFSL